jgi:hypothetical protein
MQTHFLILLSEIPVYGVLTHADKHRLNDLRLTWVISSRTGLSNSGKVVEIYEPVGSEAVQ